jgi:hypothetical protein
MILLRRFCDAAGGLGRSVLGRVVSDALPIRDRHRAVAVLGGFEDAQVGHRAAGVDTAPSGTYRISRSEAAVRRIASRVVV